MNNKYKSISKMKTFLVLWSTQSLSHLGSTMTSFALTLWLYQKTGSALQTALLSICSYAPYVLMSIFAGALSDRWDKKKVMLFSDTFAACSTIVILVDLSTFVIAFFSLLIFVKIPKLKDQLSQKGEASKNESLYRASKAGLGYLKDNPMILHLILFLAGVNLVASAFDATLPAYVLPRVNGGEKVLGIVTSSAGIATLFGSLLVTALPKPKNRIRVIIGTMLFSLTIENFLLAFTRIPALWYLGQFLGWSVVPLMSANLDVILRTTIPVEMQGRVYSCRNTLQFFTIPIGFFLGGLLVDKVLEPFMVGAQDISWLAFLFGTGKGSGAAVMMFVIGLSGAIVCILFGQILKKYQFQDS